MEGHHFSVMFYGGRLLSGLTAGEDEIKEFVHLRRLNRNLAVVMDSDKTSASAPVLETKERLVRELAEHGGVAWLTEVRTIENYVPLDVWSQAIAKVHPRSKLQWNGNHFTDPFKGLPEKPDKLRLAAAVCESRDVDLARYDLPTQLDKLVEMIRRANPSVAEATPQPAP
jgi:hypothetical protein